MDQDNLNLYKLKYLLEDGQIEVYYLETALSFVKHLSENGIGFTLEYTTCLLGEFWLIKTK